MKHKKHSSPETEPEYMEEIEDEEDYEDDDEEKDYEDDDEEEDEEEKPSGLKAFFAKIKNSFFEEVEEDEEEEEEEDEDDEDDDEDEEVDDEDDDEEEDEDEEVDDEDDDEDEEVDNEEDEEVEPEPFVLSEETDTKPDDGEIFLDAPEEMPDFREDAVPGYQPSAENKNEDVPQDSEIPVISQEELTAGLDDFFSDNTELTSDEQETVISESDNTEENEEAEEAEDEEEELNPDGTPKKSILSKLIPVALILVLALGFAYCFQLGLFDEKEAFLMPELVGRNYYELTDEEYANLDIQVNQSDYSAYDKDFIYAQSIPAGTEIKLGQTVKVDLSLGYQMTVVPDVRNYQFDYAKKLLEQTGFKTQIAYEQSLNGTTQNNVIRTVPGSNEEAAVGSEVTLYVSEGLGADAAQVQNFTGMLLEDALDLCEMYGLEVEAVPIPALQATNVVVTQSIEAGATVPFHTVITLEYSNGEQPKGTISYQLNFPPYANGRFILDFIDKDGNVIASSDIIVAGFSAGCIVPIEGLGAQEVTVVLNNCTTNLQAELGKYNFDFTTGAYTPLSEDMQGAFETVKGIS